MISEATIFFKRSPSDFVVPSRVANLCVRWFAYSSPDLTLSDRQSFRRLAQLEEFSCETEKGTKETTKAM